MAPQPPKTAIANVMTPTMSNTTGTVAVSTYNPFRSPDFAITAAATPTITALRIWRKKNRNIYNVFLLSVFRITANFHILQREHWTRAECTWWWIQQSRGPFWQRNAAVTLCPGVRKKTVCLKWVGGRLLNAATRFAFLSISCFTNSYLEISDSPNTELRIADAILFIDNWHF